MDHANYGQRRVVTPGNGGFRGDASEDSEQMNDEIGKIGSKDPMEPLLPNG